MRHENTCFCRRVRKYEELLFMCTLGIYILRGQLYDTSRSCPSICLRTVFNPSSLTEGRLQTSRQKHCFSKGKPGGTLPASVACRSIAGVVRRWWLLAQYLCLMLCLLQNVLFVFFSVEVTEECCLFVLPFYFLEALLIVALLLNQTRECS